MLIQRDYLELGRNRSEEFIANTMKKPIKTPSETKPSFNVASNIPRKGYKRFVVDKVAMTTDKALLLVIKGKEHWLPKRNAKMSYNATGSIRFVDVPRWFASLKKDMT